MIHKVSIKFNMYKGTSTVKIQDGKGRVFRFKYTLSSDHITTGELERCVAVVEMLCKDK